MAVIDDNEWTLYIYIYIYKFRGMGTERERERESARASERLRDTRRERDWVRWRYTLILYGRNESCVYSSKKTLTT